MSRSFFPLFIVASIVASASFSPLPPPTCDAAPIQAKTSIESPTPQPIPDLPPNTTPESLRRFAGPTPLDLEDAVVAADLIIVVRLVDVTESRIVHGGKQEVVTQQFRFEPVRTLKGVYARDALLMTDQDLRLYQFAQEADRIEPGQLLLLLLGRSGPGWFNCNGAGTLGQSIPRLADANDLLLRTVEALIGVTQQTDRARRVELLRDALHEVHDRASLPLLASLRRRAALAARDPLVLHEVGRVLEEPGPIAREEAARTLALLLRNGAVQPNALPTLEQRLRIVLDDPAFTDLRARVAAIDALGALGPQAVPDAVDPNAAPSLAERTAWLRAIAASDAPEPRRDAIETAAVSLPLDAPDDQVRDTFAALAISDPPAAASRLEIRARQRLAAGLGVAFELDRLGHLPAESASPALLRLATWPLAPEERLALAEGAVRLADNRFVPILATLLDPSFNDIRDAALRALIRIDSPEAAKVAWPHLAEESDLARKLRLAAFLGHHGFAGGYPYALEHLSDPNLRDLAVDALGAIGAAGRPQAIAELHRIWERSNDLSWNAAAMRGLARLRDDGFQSDWLTLANDPSHPLAPSALLALADLGTADTVPAIRRALGARGDAVVIAACRAAGVLLHDRSDAEVVAALSGLLADRQASQEVRSASLDALMAMEAESLTPALDAALRDASIEGTPLMARVEELTRARLATAEALEK